MKSNKKQRIFSFVAASAMLFVGAVGCVACESGGENGDDNKNPQDTFLGGNFVKAPTGAPDYSAHESEKMLIGAWNSSPGTNYVYTEKELSAAKEAGIDFLCDYRASRQTSSRAVKGCMEAIEASGLKLFINLSGLSYSDVAPGEDEGTSGYKALYEYLGKDYIMGLNVQDEPPAEDFAKHEATTAAFLKDFPNKQCYINLLPNYANAGQLGGKETGVTFEKYVERFTQTATSVTHYSYDFYPLLGQMSGEYVMTHALNSLWCASLETYANAAKNNNKDLWVFIQNMSFGANNRQPQSVSDITMQNYVNMCYGARCLQYFSLTTPDTYEFGEFDVGMLDRDLNKTPSFDYVKAANEELATFDHVYLQFEWENVMPVTGTVFGDNLNSGFDMLKTHMTSSEYFTATANADTVVGQFHDENGYKGYMVANLSDPMDAITDTVSMTFNANRVLVYTGGQCKTVEIPTGVYTFNLEEGGGAFLIPYNV